LFDTTCPLLEKYNATVKVGQNPYYNAVLKIFAGPHKFKIVFLTSTPLDGHGRRRLAPLVEEIILSLYDPKVILQELISAVSEDAQKNNSGYLFKSFTSLDS